MKKTVLLVCDSAISRQMTGLAMKDAGYSVIEANSGTTALEMIKAGLSPRLIIVDQDMAGMNGASFVKAARECAALRYTPVLLLIAESMSADKTAAKAMEVGATCWLKKPFTPWKLMDMVSMMIF